MTDNNVVDFGFKRYNRSYLFLKKQAGAELPEGWLWECPCGSKNILTKLPEQYCPTCGTRLKIQEHREDKDDGRPGNSFTLVRVAHFTVK
jgi:Zn finger protein HypA/HybF involved in hydrogenase expression